MRRPGVLSVWLALAAPVAALAAGEARQTLADLGRIHRALARHQQETGELPRSALDLGPVVRAYAGSVAQASGIPVDGWGRPYRYGPDTSARGYRLYSLGRNGHDEDGAGDDLVSRETADRSLYPELLTAQRKALELFPLLFLCALAPLGWALLRWARRAAS